MLEKIQGISPFSPGAHVNELTPVPAGVKGSHERADMSGSDKGATHVKGDATGADKGAFVTYSTSTANPTSNPDMTGEMAAKIMADNMAAQGALQEAPVESNKAEAALHRFWVGQRDSEEPRELPQTPLYPMDVHEINKVDEPRSATESGGEGPDYHPYEKETEEEKSEEEKLEAEEIKDIIVVDEAFSWSGHISEYHYSPEKLHTNSLEFVSSMLPFRVPISHQ